MRHRLTTTNMLMRNNLEVKMALDFDDQFEHEGKKTSLRELQQQGKIKVAHALRKGATIGENSSYHVAIDGREDTIEITRNAARDLDVPGA